MRALVRSLIIGDAGCTALIPPEGWVGSRGATDLPPRPVAVLRFGGTFGGIGKVTRRRLEVWVHRDDADYDAIEDVLKAVKKVLDGAEHQKDLAGNEMISCAWINDSTDLFDEGFRTNCMMSAYDIVGKDAS
jgi:hypothetical protein